MRKTQADILLGKFQKLVTALNAMGHDNPDWLNAVITMLERHTILDTWHQIKDVWHSDFDPATHGEFVEQMIKANSLWKEVRVHPMFK